MLVERETLIKDIVKLGPDAIKTLMNYGMGCIGCPASQNESINDAASVHGINVEELLSSLNSLQ